MVKVRLSRAGAKKRPYYHIVVTDKEKPRDGRFIEQIGTYDPSRPITEATVDYPRLDYWVGVGAQISDRVRDVIKEHKKAAAAAAAPAAPAS
jgi:small subunit ribosomal protein S16